MGGKTYPIFVSKSSNLSEDRIFFCASNPRDLVSSLIDALENMATQCRARTKMQFLHVEKTIRSKFAKFLELFHQRRIHSIDLEGAFSNILLVWSQQRFYKCKNFRRMNCRITWRDFALDYHSLDSTM